MKAAVKYHYLNFLLLFLVSLFLASQIVIKTVCREKDENR